jgi:hypothetical protein
LFSALKNDLDLRLIVEHWPELPEHIKTAIWLFQTKRSFPADRCLTF